MRIRTGPWARGRPAPRSLGHGPRVRGAPPTGRGSRRRPLGPARRTRLGWPTCLELGCGPIRPGCRLGVRNCRASRLLTDARRAGRVEAGWQRPTLVTAGGGCAQRCRAADRAPKPALHCHLWPILMDDGQSLACTGMAYSRASRQRKGSARHLAAECGHASTRVPARRWPLLRGSRCEQAHNPGSATSLLRKARLASTTLAAFAQPAHVSAPKRQYAAGRATPRHQAFGSGPNTPWTMYGSASRLDRASARESQRSSEHLDGSAIAGTPSHAEASHRKKKSR